MLTKSTGSSLSARWQNKVCLISHSCQNWLGYTCITGVDQPYQCSCVVLSIFPNDKINKAIRVFLDANTWNTWIMHFNKIIQGTHVW